MPDPHGSVPESDNECPNEAGGHRLQMMQLSYLSQLLMSPKPTKPSWHLQTNQFALIVRWFGGPAEKVYNLSAAHEKFT